MPTPFIISNPPVKRTENDDVLFENMVDRYVGRLVYTSSGSFIKNNFPYARMILVRCQAAGGAGAGATSDPFGGSGGGGGQYAESFLETTSLPSSVSVHVGLGGDGIQGLGTNGGTSKFGSLVVAVGGNASAIANGGQATATADGTGQLIFNGSGGGVGARDNVGSARVSFGGAGGASHLGAGAAGLGVSNVSTNGPPGEPFGGGGAGARRCVGGREGGDGGPGVVIVELYA